MQTQILGLLAPLMALLFGVTFAVLWRVGRLKRHVLGFGISYILFAMAFLITHFLPANAFYLFHTTHLFYALSATAMLASACERVGQRVHLGSFFFAYLVTAVVLGLTMVLSNDVGPRLIIVNMGYGVMCAMGVTTLLAAKRRDTMDIAILVVMVLQTVDFLVRPTMTLLFEQSIPVEQYRDSVYYSLIGLVLGVKGVLMGMVLIGATIAEWTTALRESSERDALSGLLNRGSFEEKMRKLIPRAHNEGHALSLVVADIDFFKKVNDIWGHQAGDQAISGIGELIANTARECDTAGRIGGEEFCIGVWDCSNEPALRLADRIRQAFANMQHPGLSDDIRLTASFGVATAHAGETYEDLFARADAALYRAKSSGRNRVENAGDLGQDDPSSKRSAEITELKPAAAG